MTDLQIRSDTDLLRQAIEDNYAFLDDLDQDEQLAYSIEKTDLCVEGMTEALVYGIQAGAALERLKERVEPGTWGRWLSENYPYSHSRANAFRRWYKNREKLLEVGASTTQDAQAVDGLLTLGPGGRGSNGYPAVSAEEIAEAEELREQGWSYRQIAEHSGVAGATIWRRLNERRVKELKQQRAEAARALKREKQRKAAAAAGVDALYAHFNRGRDMFDPAIGATDNYDLKRALRKARGLAVEIASLLNDALAVE